MPSLWNASIHHRWYGAGAVGVDSVGVGVDCVGPVGAVGCAVAVVPAAIVDYDPKIHVEEEEPVVVVVESWTV